MSILLLAHESGELLLQEDGDTILLSQSVIVPALDSPAYLRATQGDALRVQRVVEADALNCTKKLMMSDGRWQLVLEADHVMVIQVPHGDEPLVEKLL